MASVTTNFLPDPGASPPFTFSASLDGASYTVHIVWNLAGQRYYVQLIDTSGNILITHPMIGSPYGTDINLVPGLFPDGNSLVFRSPARTFIVTDATA